MRTYSNGTKAKKPGKFLKKNVYAIILGAALLVVALVVTLTLTLGIKKPIPDADKPVVVPPTNEITFVAPLKNCVLKTDAALDNLVWNETLKQWRTHNGVDFEATAGDDVYSIADGTITKVETTILDGVVVTVTHSDGYVSVYKGLESATVAADDQITAGAAIGKVGTMMSEQNRGAHLHVEMKLNNAYVNVMDYLNVNEDK